MSNQSSDSSLSDSSDQPTCLSAIRDHSPHIQERHHSPFHDLFHKKKNHEDSDSKENFHLNPQKPFHQRSSSPGPRHLNPLDSDSIHKSPSTPELFPSVRGIEKSILSDAENLMKKIELDFRQSNRNFSTANVLVTGIAGTGKSSIINHIFNQKISKESDNNFQKYIIPNQHVTVFDSKGLDPHDEEGFINRMTDFLQKHTVDPSGCTVNSIHVVWYVVDASKGMLEVFEKSLCTNFFNRYPMIFIINKRDIATEEQILKIVDDIRGLNIYVYEICEASSIQNNEMKKIEKCPYCESKELFISQKTKLATCNDCGKQTDLRVTYGLSTLIDKTIRVIPIAVREAFISAQKVSFTLKDEKVKLIISDFYNESKECSFASDLSKVFAKMLTRLSIIWDFKEHGHLTGTSFAHDVVKYKSFREKIFLFMHKHNQEYSHLTALGILWNRCVRNLCQALYTEFAKDGVFVLKEYWPTVFENSFKDLTEENLYKIESILTEKGLDFLLEEEMPSLKGKSN